MRQMLQKSKYDVQNKKPIFTEYKQAAIVRSRGKLIIYSN